MAERPVRVISERKSGRYQGVSLKEHMFMSAVTRVPLRHLLSALLGGSPNRLSNLISRGVEKLMPDYTTSHDR